MMFERTESKSQLAALYTAADVFFNATREDNYPTVNLEAEACGTPVKTFDSGGSKETITRDDSSVTTYGQFVDYARRSSRKRGISRVEGSSDGRI